MGERSARKELVFVIRMWAERDGLQSFAWRGRIELVRGRASRYFTSLSDLCDFISRAANEADNTA